MKNAILQISFVLSFLILSQHTSAQTPTLPSPFGVHPWTATVHVVDEEHNPVAGADVDVSYDIPATPDSGGETRGDVKGVTDTNGLFTTSHTGRSTGLGVIASKTGYYTTEIGYQFYFKETMWHPSFTLVVKKVGKPIAMYARRVEGGPPVFNKPVGYDLMAGDWVAPYGKGQITDIVFTGNLKQKSQNDFSYKLVVSFPNKGDGIQEFTVPNAEKGSVLRSPHEAPADGYQARIVRTMSRHPGNGTKEDMNDPNRNYFFRVRTVLDPNGNVKSALYGKIYGDFMQFSYYLDPKPNDRNIEFDPKQNLLGGLESFEQARLP